MMKFGYLTMLIFTVAGSFWLEVVLKVGVLCRIRRTLLSIAPVAIFFLIWDGYAISRHHWYFDKKQILGIHGPFNIPLEEFLSISLAILLFLALKAWRLNHPAMARRPGSLDPTSGFSYL